MNISDDTRVSTPVVSFVIVTWNGWDLLQRCLASVTNGSDQPDRLEIIVVDNGSTDDTAKQLAARFPGIRYHRLDGNRGFATANNRGAELAAAELVFLLNNDTVIERGAVDILLKSARDFPDFDIFAPQMLRLTDPTVVDNRGVYIDLTGHCRQLDCGAAVTRHRARSEVFGASAGACLLRRSVIESIGLFDESLGSYQEDCDFAFRARAAGHRCLYEPEAKILHEGSATGNRVSDQKFYQIQRNMCVVRSRWLPDRSWNVRWLLGSAYRGFHVVKAVLQGRLQSLLRARRDALAFPSHEVQYPAQPEMFEKWIGVRGQPIESST